MMSPERSSAEESIWQDLEVLAVSKRLARSVSQKLKKKNVKSDEEDAKGVSLNCLNLYGRGGGCKVGAEMGEDFGDRRRSSASEEGKGLKTICGIDETTVECFSYGVRERFWKKNNRKYLELEESVRNSRMHIFLPDDILEMCLVRLPLASLMTARLVCKKWKHLTTTQRFLQMRREGLYQNPWLFLFGAVKDGCSSGEIHAYDVSQDHWSRIESDVLKGRFMFSVMSIHEEVYIVGGRSTLTNNYGRMGSSVKTHKGILVFSPLARSWRKIASMRHARSMPIVGVSEVSSDFPTLPSHQNRQERRFHRSRIGGVSDVYEDPHRLSVRRQLRFSADESEASYLTVKKHQRLTRQMNGINSKRFVLIAIGGIGSVDEPLDSGEIYDSATNAWAEIQRLPLDFGVVCSGVICNGIFYAYSENDKLAGYDIERGFWIGIQTSPIPPRVHDFYPKLVCCKHRLFMLSVSWCEGDGQIGRRNKAVRKLWELDLMYLTWTEVSVHPDAPMDWNATFVADRNLLFGVEMFKIFGQVLDFFTVFDVAKDETTWRHVSRNQMTHELDASSCINKTVALLHL
ncbi:PREDICTED: F-box/kelch-repeat protein At5g42350-like [Tarenaya hassleriana]|uniref:F-box/kelch-repeat protein At5g42350-like n=1 Tax=Tarenaya hassleriana TaxID=28532 RepID=UPI00053C7FE6|nr:PREDICTED: F-box/kelch-repeat protein At5g42350-like [Tarenaya hassleriana]XP_010523634.1 PREDICTED: F-box/kelch-repeat protein At5g42350-like [Tarenaya hassleriana]